MMITAVPLIIPLLILVQASPHQHVGITGLFYETWKRPDRPNESCCSQLDCYDTQAHMTKGVWFARRREDGAWLSVPPQKIERNRDSPDGLSHLCAPPPLNASNYENGVICFIPGGGT